MHQIIAATTVSDHSNKELAFALIEEAQTTPDTKRINYRLQQLKNVSPVYTLVYLKSVLQLPDKLARAHVACSTWAQIWAANNSGYLSKPADDRSFQEQLIVDTANKFIEEFELRAQHGI